MTQSTFLKCSYLIIFIVTDISCFSRYSDHGEKVNGANKIEARENELQTEDIVPKRGIPGVKFLKKF